MEQTSDLVSEGRLIGETTYMQRGEKYKEIPLKVQLGEIELSAKLDYYDAHNNVVHEVKKSDKIEEAHIAQLKYYLWLLEQKGKHGVEGILEYPKLRKTLRVFLEDTDRQQILAWIVAIQKIIMSERCPIAIKKPFCKSCSYFDFCYVGELEDSNPNAPLTRSHQ